MFMPQVTQHLPTRLAHLKAGLSEEVSEISLQDGFQEPSQGDEVNLASTPVTITTSKIQTAIITRAQINLSQC